MNISQAPASSPSSGLDAGRVNSYVNAMLASYESGALASNDIVRKLHLDVADWSRKLQMIKDSTLSVIERENLKSEFARELKLKIQQVQRGREAVSVVRQKQAEEDRLSAESNAQLLAYVRKFFRRALMVGLPLTAIGLSGWGVYRAGVNPVRRVTDRLMIQDVAKDAQTHEREAITPRNPDLSLDGATINFTCADSGGDWTPVDDDKVTVRFTNDQIAANLPAALMAKEAFSADLFTMPTGAFVEDPNGIVGSMFTTGGTAEDGALLNYFILDSFSGLACSGTSTAGDTKDVSATLASHMPELGLSEFLGSVPEADPTFTAQFEEYGLDDWYEDEFYPVYVQSVDNALRIASRKGVTKAELQPFADSLSNRDLEKGLLRMLKMVKDMEDPQALDDIVKQVRDSRAPIMDFTASGDFNGEEVAITTFGSDTDTMTTAFDTRRFGPENPPQFTILSSLTRSFFQHNKTQDFPGTIFSDSLRRDPIDLVTTESIGQWMSIVGTESDAQHLPESIREKYMLIEPLLRAGKGPDLVKYMAFDQKSIGGLSFDNKRLLGDLGVEEPVSPLTASLYAIIIDATGVSRESDQPKKDALVGLLRAFNDMGELEYGSLKTDPDCDAKKDSARGAIQDAYNVLIPVPADPAAGAGDVQVIVVKP